MEREMEQAATLRQKKTMTLLNTLQPTISSSLPTPTTPLTISTPAPSPPAHAPSQPSRSFPCLVEECDKVLYRKQDRDRHMATHTSVKNFECGRCGQRFARRDGRTRHEKSGRGCLKNLRGRLLK
ncbi:hypothetical protein BC829DRAFT_399324, partial [Chytridium lagenaria]